MVLFTKKYINIKDFNSVKKFYLNFFNVEIYSMINSSLYSIVFRLLYLSFMFFFLFLVDLNSYTSIISGVMGLNSFNLIYIIKLFIAYFILYSIIILFISRFLFLNNPRLFDNLLDNLNNISLFLYKKLAFIFFKIIHFIKILGLSPSEFEKYLNYEKK